MTKIIIENDANIDDQTAVRLIHSVVSQGKRSGENQYCFATHFNLPIGGKVSVVARKSRGNTHSFKIIKDDQ